MPTYAFKCGKCDAREEFYMPVYEYVRNPPTPRHCGELMGREIEVDSGRALDHPEFGETRMDGLRSPEGYDISTRSKRNAYMRSAKVAPTSEFSAHFSAAAREARRREAERKAKNDRISILRHAFEAARNKQRAIARFG